MARSYTVKRTSAALVAPCAPTPTGTLPLSAIDKLVGVRRPMVPLIQVFTYGQDPAKTIKKALAGALVPYYPVAGRIAVSSEGEFHVACTGEGVWFAEATADCSLEDVDHLALPLRIPEEDLLPIPAIRNEHPDLTLAMQVTEFTCGGFVVCFGLDHIMFDGVGIMQFLGAIGDIARGLEQPIIDPIWCREAIPGPPKQVQECTPRPVFTEHRMQYCTVDVIQDDIDYMKDEYLRETGQRCSTFDVLVAMIWQCRTKAIQPDPQAEVRIIYPANVRHLLRQVLPSQHGYYGNCVFLTMVEAEAEMIMSAPFIKVLQLVLDVKARRATDFRKWVDGELEMMSSSIFSYETITLPDWRTIGSQQVDYGWGLPYLLSPMRLRDYCPTAVIIDLPPPRRGIRLVAQFVREEHMTAFCDGMTALARPSNREPRAQQSVLS